MRQMVKYFKNTDTKITVCRSYSCTKIILIPATVCPRLCSWDLFWADIFPRRAKLYAQPAFVLVSVGCRLILTCFSVKISFIKSLYEIYADYKHI